MPMKKKGQNGGTSSGSKKRKEALFPIGTKVEKVFYDAVKEKSRPFGGIVERHDMDDEKDNEYLYWIQYPEDGDGEHMTEEEVKQHLLQSPVKKTVMKDEESTIQEASTSQIIPTTSSTSTSTTTTTVLSPSLTTKRSTKQASLLTFFNKQVMLAAGTVPSSNKVVTSSSIVKTTSTLKKSTVSKTSTLKKNEDKKKKNSRTNKAGSATKRSKTVPRDDEDDIATPADVDTVDDKNSDENVVPSTKRRRTAAQKTIRYTEDDDGEDAFMDSDSDVPVVTKKLKKRKTVDKRKKTKTKNINSDDDSDASMASIASDEDEDVDFDSEEEEQNVKPVSKRSRTSKTTTAATNKTTKKTTTKSHGASSSKSSTKKDDDDDDGPRDDLILNYPTYKNLALSQIAAQKDYLDPCGREATDDIIDHLVGDQVDKIGALLQRALQPPNKKKNSKNTDIDPNAPMGSVWNPLQLGTACSGTDAPALALTIVQEQLELRDIHAFSHSHAFSCENDPFKQAYLARNFDSQLYPDITRLVRGTCELKDEKNDQDDKREYIPKDVYGQEQPIPPFTMFVAGTSCKNFSMLRSKWRMDIEEKGCSGETFLAATEVLFQKQPEMAIFENVLNAPWDKMSEYITGRVKLSNAASSKFVGKEDTKKKQDLTFSRDKGKIVVEVVPAVYGVRCGAVVQGFVTPNSPKVHPVVWPSSSSKTCTLDDLIKKNKISKVNDILVFETPCTYCTQLIKVDTKEFGLPQTRQRKYMLVWKPDKENIADDLGEYWVDLVNHLKSPVRHSLDSFLLDVDHETIRTFREALVGPAGRTSKRMCALEGDFWASDNKNLEHNKACRKAMGLGDRARWLTQWGPYGHKQIPPHYWLEYMNCNFGRVVDFIDILFASSIRDAESHDALFCNYFWNVSQSAGREKHRSACPGIAGCVTPGGDFFIPNKGRPMLGCEKLLTQGIPYFRLILGNESEVQLGDLAGNAMSLTVVCATMLAAMTCKQFRKEIKESSTGKLMAKTLKSAREDYLKKSCALEGRKDTIHSGLSGSDDRVPMNSASHLFRKLAALAPEAVDSSIWCTCETSGSNSREHRFLLCQNCGVSSCRVCVNGVAGYNLSSHDTTEVIIEADRHNMANFQTKLRDIVPASLKLSKDGWTEIMAVGKDRHRVKSLIDCTFNLHRIKRDRKKWLVLYYARENYGVGEAIAELRLIVGELGRGQTQAVQLGMMVEVKSFLPARTPPFVFGPLPPCAKVTVLHNSKASEKETWSCIDVEEQVSALVEGFGSTPSLRKEIGLMDSVPTHIRKLSEAKSEFKAAKARGEERRWIYPENWDSWPESISITFKENIELSQDINGIYKRATCRQTTNQSVLYIQTGNFQKPALYILVQPNVNRTGPDEMVVSSSCDHGDASSILAIFPQHFQPSDAFKAKLRKFTVKKWVRLSTMECLIPQSSLVVSTGNEDSDVLVSVAGLSLAHVSLMCRGVNPKENMVKLSISGGQQGQSVVRVFNSICVAPILKLAATTGLKYDVTPDSTWMKISPTGNIAFGQCTATVPERPSETWSYSKDLKLWERSSSPGASRKFFLKLQAAPTAFELWLDRSKQTLIVKCYPEVMAHHAASRLIRGRGLSDEIERSLSVVFKLSDVTQQSDPTFDAFTVANCQKESATDVALKGPYKLYERQQKVVTKMIAIENGTRTFDELDMCEYPMPGSAGLTLTAKASRRTNIRGGVIADAIGAGKTVISIAIILSGLQRARAARDDFRKSSATLVVVPPALIDQWYTEIKKFTNGLIVVRIYDFASYEKAYRKKNILEADVVICPIDILEAVGYFKNLLKLSGDALKEYLQDVPKLPDRAGQRETNAARGVWIPHASTDPYNGEKTPTRQKKRDQSAFYTYVYQKAINSLREQKFQQTKMGVPLEFFEFERIIVDEIHESLCTSKADMQEAAKDKGYWKEKNRRAGREFLGITQRNPSLRPVVCRGAMFGLTGTPLLDSSSRVIELANLMGGIYVTGLSSHWRKLERESCRDIFLHNYLEPKQSREVRKTISAKCQEFLDTACCRNKCGEEMDGINLNPITRQVRMSENEKVLYFESQKKIPHPSFSTRPEDFDPELGQDLGTFLRQNARLECRSKELVKICGEILEKDATTKIIVFTDGAVGAGLVARDCLQKSGMGCTWLDREDTVAVKNQKISWYQTTDATEEDRARPRVLILHFEHAAGLNLQMECYNLILFTPLYTGNGMSDDPVADTSTELQAIGRVYRAGQPKSQVNVFRIEVQGPNGEDCLDGQVIRRNTDSETIDKAVNDGDD